MFWYRYTVRFSGWRHLFNRIFISSCMVWFTGCGP